MPFDPTHDAGPTDPYTAAWLAGGQEDAVELRSTVAEGHARTLGEWLADPSLLDPPAVLLPNLAILGRCTLLSGREKSGKSTLTAQLVAAASRGHPVLGVPIAEPLGTLWYAVDEPLGDAVRRFSEMDADPTRMIVSDAPRNVADFLSQLPLDLAAHPGVRVVVVDTLSRLFSAVDVNQSDKVEPLLWRVVDLLRKHGCAAVLLYHTGKGGAEYRGSTAIGATVDEILTLKRRGREEDKDDFEAEDDEDDGRRVLVLNGRNLRGRVQLDYRAGRYALFDELHPPRERLLEALSEEPAKSRSELAKRAKVKKQTGLALITELIASGEIVETGDGLAVGTGIQAGGNRIESAGGSRFPAGLPEGTAREPRTGTEGPQSSSSVPRTPTLGGARREPLDVAI